MYQPSRGLDMVGASWHDLDGRFQLPEFQLDALNDEFAESAGRRADGVCAFSDVD
jgi:hypothetical protein